jgi:hypothetical protein
MAFPIFNTGRNTIAQAPLAAWSVRMLLTGDNELLGEKLIIVAIYPRQILQEHASGVRDRQLTA